MKILLINPSPSGTLKATGVLFPPLGLLYVAAYAEKEGHQVAVRDLAVRKKKEDIVFKKYDIVGISTDTTRHRQALELAKRAKVSGCTVVMGGPHPGYGDQDSLPLPARHLLHMDDYRRTKLGDRDITPLVTSRGCPYECAFCASSHFFGATVRTRSVASVLSEIEEIYHRYHFNAVAFVDDTFNLFPKRVIEICHGIIEKKLDLWWWCLSRVDLLLRNEEMVKEMVRAGAKSVFIGVESFNTKTLEELKKGIDVESTVQAVEMLKKNGLEIHAAYILGGQHETAEMIHETIRFAKRLNTNVAQFSILTPYPGTAIYEQVKDRIFKWRAPWSFFDMH